MIAPGNVSVLTGVCDVRFEGLGQHSVYDQLLPVALWVLQDDGLPVSSAIMAFLEVLAATVQCLIRSPQRHYSCLTAKCRSEDIRSAIADCSTFADKARVARTQDERSIVALTVMPLPYRYSPATEQSNSQDRVELSLRLHLRARILGTVDLSLPQSGSLYVPARSREGPGRCGT
jgi:hypothetical protein